jgi:hypothetical protein
MQWYATLVDKKNLRMREYLDHIRGAVLSMNDEDDKMDVDGMHFPNLGYIRAYVAFRSLLSSTRCT